MQIPALAFLFAAHCLPACQQSNELSRPVSDAIGIPAVTASLGGVLASDTEASNILFRSDDGGQTWQDVSAGLPKDVPVWSFFLTGQEVMVGTDRGLFRSSMATSTPDWEKDFFCNEGITGISPGRYGPYLCSYDHGFYQEIPGTGILSPKHNALSDKAVCAVLELQNGSLLAACKSGIYKTSDNGKNWKQVYSGGLILDLVSSGNVLVAGGVKGVLRSTDDGEHWENVLNENILAKRTTLLQNRFVTILGAEDVSVLNTDGITKRLRVSDDGGKTWHRMERALLPVEGAYDMDYRLAQTHDIYDIVQVGKYLLCTFDTGIYRSADEGKTWEPVFPSTEKRILANLKVSGNVVYAMAGGGC